MRDDVRVSAWNRLAGAVFGSVLLATRVLAGGSGLNVAVVVNQNSPDSVELGNYYCEQRGVPPQNLLRVNWAGGNTAWTTADFESFLRTPFTTMLANRQLTNQIDVVLLCMELPYRVTLTTGDAATSGVNSSTAALFYGFKPDGCSGSCPANLPSCNLAPASTNLYAGSEAIFRSTPPLSASSNSWLVMMLTSSNLALAKQVVDRGVTSDALAPTQEVYLAKGTDRLRNIRHYLFDEVMLNTRILGAARVVRTNVSDPTSLGVIQGYQCGEQVFSLSSSNFLPGALVDNLTSYGGLIFQDSGHTDALDCLNAGATASHGTVVEPCAYLQKFPSPQLFFYQARGFSAVESYYQSLTNPYQGLLLGEPLAAPFAAPASGTWLNLPVGAVLAGTTNLNVQFQAGTAGGLLQQVDLFIDGLWAQTLTNLPPQPNNILYVTLNGAPTNYPVPANASLQSVASNLTLRLNASAFTNATKVVAFAHGDRIELQSLDLARAGTATTLVTSNYLGAASFLTTRAKAARPDFLDRVAQGLRSYVVTNALGSNLPTGSWLQAMVFKTNGSVVTMAVTNASSTNTLRLFARELFDRLNTNAALAAADGILVDNINLHEDPPYAQYIYGYNDHSGEFDVLARSPGWLESQISVRFTSSSGLAFTPGTTKPLDENFADLRPRNHIYLTAGLTNLNLTFPFNTTTNADGYHELTAVAYEGSHVRTQKRIAQNVRLQNHAWSATLDTLLGGTNTALEATLQFAVVASTNNITKIEFFTTGGLFATSNNVASTTFAIAASYLGIGLHPFYALITRNDGQQYRTETKWLRIVGPEPPFSVSLQGTVPTLIWPASAGRPYQVLSGTDLTHTFLPRAAVTPTNSTGRWSETNNTAPQRFYRVTTP